MLGHTRTGFPLSLLLLLLAGLLLLSASGCSETEGNADTTLLASGSVEARVIQVREQDWPQVVATQGNLDADEVTVVGAKVAGRIDQVAVDLGDQVNKGALLASLDRREHQERVRQAEAELTQALASIGLDRAADLSELDPQTTPIVIEQKALWDQSRIDRDRLSSLRNRQVAAGTDYDSAVTAEQVAKARYATAINEVLEKIATARVRDAQLALASQQLEDAEIRAPYDSRIQDRHVSAGSYVQIGDPIVTLIRDNPVRYRGTVPEPYASSIAIGQTVRLFVESRPESIEVAITRISPAIDPFSRSLLFEAIVPNEDRSIQAGRFSQGEVVLDEARRAVALPKSAIVQFAGTQKVWKVVKGHAVEQPIEIGEKRKDRVEILSGLEPGDLVLIDGSKGRDAKVEIQEIIGIERADHSTELRDSKASH